MLHPIQKDHESCCPNCGCVLGTVEEYDDEVIKSPIVKQSSINILLLGTAVNNIKSNYRKSPQEVYEQNIIRNLDSIVKKFDLPQRFVLETFKEMKRKNRGFRSEYEYVKQLIKILSRDENYEQIHKLKKIKAWYEKFSNL